MAQVYTWQQKKFDGALKRYLGGLKAEKIPNALNKKAFFLTRRALNESPKKDPYDIVREVSRTITVKNDHGEARTIPMIWVLAAKRASKKWTDRKFDIQLKRLRKMKSAKTWMRAWSKEITKKSKAILGGRRAASGFLRVGWLSSMLEIGKSVKNRSGAPYVNQVGLKIKGRKKGAAKPATGGIRPVCTVENMAESKSTAKHAGLVRFGAPGLNKAFALEAQDITDFLNREIKPATDAANAALK